MSFYFQVPLIAVSRVESVKSTAGGKVRRLITQMRSHSIRSKRKANKNKVSTCSPKSTTSLLLPPSTSSTTRERTRHPVTITLQFQSVLSALNFFQRKKVTRVCFLKRPVSLSFLFQILPTSTHFFGRSFLKVISPARLFISDIRDFLLFA